MSGIATAAAAIPWQIIKRSAANTGGTSTTPTCVPMNQHRHCRAGCCRAYTVSSPGALGTSAGLIEAKRGTVLTAAAGTPASPTVFDFCPGAKYPTLNGGTEVLSLNLGEPTPETRSTSSACGRKSNNRTARSAGKFVRKHVRFTL